MFEFERSFFCCSFLSFRWRVHLYVWASITVSICRNISGESKSENTVRPFEFNQYPTICCFDSYQFLPLVQCLVFFFFLSSLHFVWSLLLNITDRCIWLTCLTIFREIFSTAVQKHKQLHIFVVYGFFSGISTSMNSSYSLIHFPFPENQDKIVQYRYKTRWFNIFGASFGVLHHLKMKSLRLTRKRLSEISNFNEWIFWSESTKNNDDGNSLIRLIINCGLIVLLKYCGRNFKWTDAKRLEVVQKSIFFLKSIDETFVDKSFSHSNSNYA